MTTANVFIIIAIVIYLVGMLSIGVVYSKRNKTSSDFYLGGRKLGPVVVAMSTEASDMSSWLLMGVPGLAYFCGLADATWTVIGLAVGTYLNWLIVAKRLRGYSAKLGAITIPDFFSHRYGDKSGLIEGIAALVIIVFFVPYTASGFAACGKLFTNLFDINYMTAMIISAAVIVAYCAMGGFTAASVTSLIQSIVMTIALIVVLVFGIHVAGGWDAVVANAKTVPGYLSLTSSTDIFSTTPGKYGFITICSTLAWGLGYFGMPHIIIRFMSVKSQKELRKSSVIGITWTLIILTMSVLAGALVGVMIFSAYQLITDKMEHKDARVKDSGTASEYAISDPASPTPRAYEQEVVEAFQLDDEVSPINSRYDLNKFFSDYPDAVAWIYCPGTPIDYGVVEAEDNDFYLRRFLDGSYSVGGSLFVDCNCNRDFSSENTVIYGHNMNDGSKFACLLRYSDEAYRTEHPVMYISTRDMNYRLEIFAGYLTDADSDTYTFTFSSEDAFADYLQRMVAQSDFKTDVQVGPTDHIVTLSTCSYEFYDARYVLQGKLVPIH